MIIPFELPWFLLFIPFGLIAVWKLVRQKSAIGFSSATVLQGIGIRIPFLFFERLALCVFVIASFGILARPIRSIRSSEPVYQEARDIVVALDVSGSMRLGADQNLAHAVRVISEFVAGRPQDRIALFVFETQAYMEWPLSSDHETVIYRLNHLIGGGGTAIASGITAGLEHLARFGQNPGAVIVVSDGASNIRAEEKAAIEANLGETKFYWIWIESSGPDDLALAFGDYVTSLGGKVYRGELEQLGEFFTEISQLEASPVVWVNNTTTIYNFGLLPLAALISLLGAGLIHLLREV